MSDQEGQTPRPLQDKAAGPEGRKPLVLVVDDMPDNTYVLRLFLEENGYEVMEATDAHQALTLARERKPDIAICDVIMPVMLGWELCQKLKLTCAPKYLPVIMLTSKSAELDEIRSYESSADAHFTKPPNIPALVEAIDRLLRAHARTAD
ncbi:MAG: response regulator [Elusimicrobia bacterium]|nr:response regulator [Elusimicrobiota bacterium]